MGTGVEQRLRPHGAELPAGTGHDGYLIIETKKRVSHRHLSPAFPMVATRDSYPRTDGLICATRRSQPYSPCAIA